MESKGQNNSAHQITPRKIDISELESTHYWVDGDPFKTHYMNALSIVFPAGEKFFVESVRHYREQISDPVLKKQIADFIQQEANHSIAHSQFNGISIEAKSLMTLTKRFQNYVDINKKISSPKAKLAQTVCLEHITAIFGNYLLTSDVWKEGVSKEHQAIWLWHAIEEIEHKAVTFDTYQAVDGSYWRRVLTMLILVPIFNIDILIATCRLLFRDGQLFKWRTIKSAYQFLLGKRGLFREGFKHFCLFFRKDFHPWLFDDRELIKLHEKQFAKA